jgi:O-antigen ligase
VISISAAATAILYLIVAGIVFWLLWWLIDYCTVPEPFNKVLHVIVAVLAVGVIIGILVQVVGGVQVFRAAALTVPFPYG